MRAFIDTNVIMDYLTVRSPFFESASLIIDMCDRKEIEGIISSLTIINCAYILRKAFSKDIMFDKVQWMVKNFVISSVNRNMLLTAISYTPYDFEDAVQQASAMSEFADVIITRDNKGFRNSSTLVLSPSEFIDCCMKG